MESTNEREAFMSKALLQPKRRHGLYIDVANIKRNTRAGVAIDTIKKALREWVGEGTAGTELLIQRIAYKVVRLSMYEASRYDDPDLDEAAIYLPMSNSLRLDLAALSSMAGRGRPPDLQEYLEQVYGKETC